MLSWPPASQRVFDERARRRGRVGTGAEPCDVGGVGQVVPESVGAQQQRARAGGGDRLHARFRPRLRFGVGAEPTGQRVCAALHGFRVGRGAGGDQFLRQGVVDCQLLRRCRRFGKPVRPAVADVADRDLHCPCGGRDDCRRGIRARRRGRPDPCPSAARRGLRRVRQTRQHRRACLAGRGERGEHRIHTRLRGGDRGHMRITGGGDPVAHGDGDRVRPLGVAADHDPGRGGVLVAGVFDTAVGDQHDPAEICLVAIGLGAPMAADGAVLVDVGRRCRSRSTAPPRTVPAAVWRLGGSPTTRRRSSHRTGRRAERPLRTAGTSPADRSYPCPRPNRICLLHQRDTLPHVGRLVRQLAVAAFHPGPDAGFVESRHRAAAGRWSCSPPAASPTPRRAPAAESSPAWWPIPGSVPRCACRHRAASARPGSRVSGRRAGSRSRSRAAAVKCADAAGTWSSAAIAPARSPARARCLASPNAALT